MSTGQLFFRDTGETTPDGRKLMAVVGLCAMDTASQERIKPECKYTFTGRTVLENHVPFFIYPATEEDKEAMEEYGHKNMLSVPIGSLLTLPMWKY